ncbi:MAG: hypothetical protein ACI39H_09065 [Lachnospiraceae bacterium]
MRVKLPYIKKKKDGRYCNLIYILIILLYRILLDITYYFWISKFYSYWGMSSTFVIKKVVLLSGLFVFIFIPFILKHCTPRKSTDYIMLVWDFMYFIPGTTYITYETCSNKYIAYYLLFYFSIMIINEIIPCNKITFTVDNRISKIIISGLVIVTAFFVFKYNGLNIKINMDNVYEIRSQFSLSSLPIIFRYLKNPMGNIIPILLYIALKKRKYIISGVLMLIQLGIFSMGAGKINLIFLVIAIVATFVKLDSKIIVYGFGGIMLASVITSALSPNPMDGFITDKLVRRMMITPNNLSYEYFNFFQTNELILFKSSVLKFFTVRQPYDKPISYVIGEYLGTGANANNGLAGDAYANLGMYAILVYPLFYGLLFYFFNWFTNKVDKEVIILSAFIIAVILIDSTFFTSFLTHGIALILFILFIYPYKIRNVKNARIT